MKAMIQIGGERHLYEQGKDLVVPGMSSREADIIAGALESLKRSGHKGEIFPDEPRPIQVERISKARLPRASKLSIHDQVLLLQKWARENYSNGADRFVECYDRDAYIEMIKDQGSVSKALAHMKELAAIFREQQADADSYMESY